MADKRDLSIGAPLAKEWQGGMDRWVPDLRSVRRWLDSNLGSLIEEKIREKEQEGGPIKIQDILEAIPNKEKLRELMNMDQDVALPCDENEAEGKSVSSR